MWTLWRKSTTWHKLPSELYGGLDPLPAWMLDNAVLYFGTVVENMLAETDEVAYGNSTRHVKRYTLSRLLDESFLYPNEEDEAGDEFSAIEGLIID